jgi:hypothetical protein
MNIFKGQNWIFDSNFYSTHGYKPLLQREP